MTEFEKECIRDARQWFRDADGAAIEPYLIAMHNQLGITQRLPLAGYMQNQRTKDMLREALIGFVHKGASEIIFVSEIWRAHGAFKIDSKKEMKKFADDAQEWIALHGSMKGFPGVREYLMLTHYSDDGDRLHFAEILKGRKLDKWQDMEDPASDGRFVNIFKQARTIQGN
jgi:hypothetical protein